MARVRVSGTADADIAYILSDLAGKAGYRTAARYGARFERLYDRLASYPDLGPQRRKLGRNIRIGIVPPYIVIYQYATSDDSVSILRILHGRRKITPKLLKERP